MTHLSSQITKIVSFVLTVTLLIGIWLAYNNEKSRLEAVIKDRTHRILLSLQASHTQAMIYRGHKQDNNPVINALNDSLSQLSSSQKNSKLWLYMGPKVIVYQKSQGSTEIEPPLDPIDHLTLDTKKDEYGFITKSQYRYSIPVVLGEGAANNEKCFSCHANDMNMHQGDVIGGFSISYDAQPDIDSFQLSIIKMFAFISSLILLNAYILISVIRHYVSNPIEKVANILQDITHSKSTNIAINTKGHSHEISLILKSAKKLNDYASNRSQEILSVVNQHSIVAITDTAGTITHVNEKFCDISGYTRDELIGSNHRILNSGHHDKEFFNDMFMSITKGETWQGDICNKNKKGHKYWVDSTISPILDAYGKVESYIAIRSDISLIKSAQESLILAKHSAEESMQTKSDFLANMSHEIRTPMNGVLGMINILKSTELNDNQHKKLGMAHESAQSLLSIINEILDFSKIESGNLDIEEVSFNIKTLLGDLGDSYGLRLEEKQLELIIDCRDVQTPMVLGDPGRIRQIINNLLGNAIKFTEKGEITIKAALTPIKDQHNHYQLHCSVTDSGVGISGETIEKLFTPFTQADSSTTRKYGGTGLGLSISKKLCQLMQGDIQARSELGKGSTFEFNIQLKAGAQSTTAPFDLNISETRILIVDDNPTNLEVLSSQLHLWGAQVVKAKGGQEALKCLQNNDFSLAILDMQMPDMDGAELGQLIRKNRHYDAIKLVMMTSMSHRGDASYFASLGFEAYIPKPVSTNDLQKALAVLKEDKQALKNATPLVTTHYLHELENPAPSIPDKCRILLVDDVAINLEVVKCLLEDTSAIIDTACNGVEAIELLTVMDKEAAYDAILMDCQMPEMDGYQAAIAIRKGDAGQLNTQIPIIAMTANALSHDKQKCLDSGMNDYISKPVDPDTLFEKLHAWIKPSAP